MKTKSIIHPAVVVSLLWGCILLFYNILEHDLFWLSDKFYYTISLWVIPFCFSSLLLLKVRIDFPEWLKVNAPKNNFISFITPFLLITNLYYFFRLYTLSGDLSVYNLYLDDTFNNPLDVKVVAFFHKLSIIVSLCIILFKIQINKIIVFLLFITIFLDLFFRGVRGNIFQYVVALFMILYFSKKISIAKLLLMAGIGCLLILVTIRLTRYSVDEEYDYGRFFAVYTFSPLPAFDLILNGEINYSSEKKTFRYFDTLNSIIDKSKKKPNMIEEFVNVPLPTNVYTVMFTFYNDYKSIGVFLFAGFLGIFWGIIYKGIQYKIPFLILFYAILFYSLVFQFFADYIFLQLHSILQFLFIIYILCIRHKSVL